MTTDPEISLEGWSIGTAEELDWMPWIGSAGVARAKVLGSADGYTAVMVQAEPGYTTSRPTRTRRTS